jgi:hypothetical protein
VTSTEESASSDAAQSTIATLIAPAAVGGELIANVLVSGARKTAASLADPNESTCGNHPRAVRSYERENFAWLELTNPADVATSVSLSVEQGPGLDRAALVAYASRTAPASANEQNDCLTSSAGGWMPGSPFQYGPSLAIGNGRGLVIPAHGSVYVMLATQQNTGSFKVRARTEQLGLADIAALPVAAEGATSDLSVLVSGARRSATFLPSPSDSSCGARARSARSYDRENFAYVELQNPSDSAAMVSLSVEGGDVGRLALFAYGSATPPNTDAEEERCLTSSNGGWDRAAQQTFGPAFSNANGKGLVVPAHGSTFVMLATGATTGAFRVKARTEKLGTADIATLTLPASGTEQMTVLVSGGQRTATSLPSPRDSACGSRSRSARSLDRENFAWVEVKNISDDDASVALTLDGAQPAQLAMFAYTSATPPATDAEENDCLVSSSGGFMPVGAATYGPAFSSASQNSLIVEAHSSVHVLLATLQSTGALTLRARLERLE